MGFIFGTRYIDISIVRMPWDRFIGYFYIFDQYSKCSTVTAKCDCCLILKHAKD